MRCQAEQTEADVDHLDSWFPAYASKDLSGKIFHYVFVASGSLTDRYYCFKSDDINNTEGGQIQLKFVTIL